jgi:hypothetical protein
MKRIKIFFLTIMSVFLTMTACDEGFDEMNINPVQPTTLDPVFLMNQAILETTFSGSTLPYELAIVQQIVSPNSGVLAGGNYNQDNRPVTQGTWNKYYRNVIKHTTDVMRLTADDDSRSNLFNMARIIHAHAMMVLTDTYGDIPYTQAGLGFLDGVVSPVYDPQESVYSDILSELEAAAGALDAGKSTESGEVLYGGDITKWKRLGYSLLLRAAMRHSKVAPNVASEFVGKAVAGGVMQSNDDNAVIYHDFNYTNQIGNTLNATEANNYYLAAPFVTYLKENDDPRLMSISVRYKGAISGPDQNNTINGNPPAGVERSIIPEDQIGMPMGYDNETIVPVAANLGLASFYDFSQLDRTRMGARDAPVFLVTYSQTSLLLAEAAVRGWTQGNAAALYEQGIRAHMAQLADYGDASAVPQEAIDTYVAANPLDQGDALEQINTQYWVVSFLNGPESFANFRRSGFPALAPNPFPGSEINGDFIRRLTYPTDEFSVNITNIQQAISRMGPDNLDTRVWWDAD